MKWRDTLRMPVGEAARLGANKVARLLQTDVRDLFGSRSHAPQTSEAQPEPLAEKIGPTTTVVGTTAAQAALAPRVDRHPAPHSLPQEKTWWEVGEVAFDLYEIQRVLAANASTRAYLARHRLWGIPLVLKVPGEALREDAARLAALAQAAMRWTQCGLHPHIAYCFTVHHAGQVPVFVIEHVDGGSLRQWLTARSVPTLRQQLDVAIQLCHALEYAHSRALTHGGLKPENILLTAVGLVRVTDFGVTLQRGGSAEAYLAPEQWVDGGPSDIASDIFALGVCLYELFCHGRPYEITRGPRRKPAEPLAVNGSRLPAPLAELLEACVDWEPLRRPRAVSEVRLQLVRLREELFRRPSPFAVLPPNTFDADGWNNQGMVALAAGKTEDAECAFEAALAADTRHLEANFNLGVLRWRSGNGSDEALLSALASARAPREQPWLPNFLQALVALESGDGDKALDLLQDLRAALPENEELAELERAARRCRPPHSVARELVGHSQVVSAVAMSNDGKWVLSGGDDHALLLWDAFAGTAVRSLEGHRANVTALAMTPDGRSAVSGSEDGTVILWDLQRGRPAKSLRLAGKVFALTLAQDGRFAVVSSAGSDNFLGIDGTIVDLWDLEKERPVRRLEGHSSSVKALAMTPDARRLVSGGDDQKLILWDLLRGQALRTFAGHEHFVSSVAISADGQTVASGSWDRTLRLWDARTGKCKGVLRGHSGIVTSVRLSEDATVAVSGSWDGTVRVWDLARQRCIRTLQGHRGMVTSVALAAAARCLASASWDASVRLWNLPQPGPEVCTPRLSSRYDYAALPPAEPTAEERIELAYEALRAGDVATSVAEWNRLAADGGAADPRLQDLLTALRPRTRLVSLQAAGVDAEYRLGNEPTAALFDAATNRWLLATRTGQLVILDLARPEAGVALDVSGAPLRALALLPGDTVIATAGFDRRIYLVDPAAASELSVLPGHESIVACLLSLPSGRIASASYDHTVRLWDAGARACVTVLRGHERQVVALAATDTGKFLASGDLGGTVVLWDPESGRMVCRWQAHEGAVHALQFIRGGELLVSGGSDGQLKMWEVASRECCRSIAAHEGGVTHVLPVWADGSLVTAGVDGTLRFWGSAAWEQSSGVCQSSRPTAVVACDGELDRLLVGDPGGHVQVLRLRGQLAERC
ncbi:MAG: protein kinase [Candidatus Binatia bacterium]|nr:protein kinase [Candidatus Binatia bacterium]